MIENKRGAVNNSALWSILGVLMFIALFYIWPQYSVWQQGLAGQAALARATQDRQIKVQEAVAAEEAARHYKQAEITRSEGHAVAIKIVGEQLKSHPNYVNYMWVNMVAEREHPTIIYVPTEANLPILEAGRLKGK